MTNGSGCVQNVPRCIVSIGGWSTWSSFFHGLTDQQGGSLIQQAMGVDANGKPNWPIYFTKKDITIGRMWAEDDDGAETKKNIVEES